MKSILTLLLLALLSPTALTQDSRPLQPQWQVQESPCKASLRGLCAVDSKVAWASGSDGTFLRTEDGGQTWQAGVVPGAEKLDFRDVQAFDKNSAILLSAGEPAAIYCSNDAGKTWTRTYENKSEGVFFDAMDFWDAKHGMAFSDPIAGHLLIIHTKDAGRSWQQVPSKNIPPAMKGEAGFAASGTCLTTVGKERVWIGLGGKQARVFASADQGKTWSVSNTPLAQESQTAGIYSLAFFDAQHGVAVGGDYTKPLDSKANAAITEDGGKTWQAISKQQPGGHRACVTYLGNSKGQQLVTVGRQGTDFSIDGGKTWKPFGSLGFYVVSSAKDGSTWAAGANGRIAKLVWP